MPSVYLTTGAVVLTLAVLLFVLTIRWHGGLRSPSWPCAVAVCTGGGFLITALGPFPIAGETWGMVWYEITLPLSAVCRPFLSGEPYPQLFIAVTTALCASGWAAVVFVFTIAIRRFGFRKRPE